MSSSPRFGSFQIAGSSERSKPARKHSAVATAIATHEADTKGKKDMDMETSTTRRNFLKASAAGVTCAVANAGFAQEKDAPAELILTNGRITTLDKRQPAATAVAIKAGRFVAVGDDKDVLAHRGGKTQVVDLQKRWR
jgi:hypothetical protein